MMSVVTTAWVVAIISPMVFVQSEVPNLTFEDMFLVYQFKFIWKCIPELGSLHCKAKFGYFSSACWYFEIKWVSFMITKVVIVAFLFPGYYRV